MRRTTRDDITEKVGITLPISLVKQTAPGDIPELSSSEEQSNNIS